MTKTLVVSVSMVKFNAVERFTQDRWLCQTIGRCAFTGMTRLFYKKVAADTPKRALNARTCRTLSSRLPFKISETTP